MTETENRRPLASRNAGWAKRAATWLTGTSVTPNQISIMSMIAGILAGAAFWSAGGSAGVARAALLIAAALFCQLRLICNLLDGMVATEGGKQTADGAFWNEFPDRVSDIAILAGLGYGVGQPALGWAAAAFAVFTAYVRELGRASGAPADYSGPMAKPQRMAVVTAAAALTLFEPLWNGRNEVLVVALWAVAVGAALTVLRRAVRLLRHFNR